MDDLEKGIREILNSGGNHGGLFVSQEDEDLITEEIMQLIKTLKL